MDQQPVSSEEIKLEDSTGHVFESVKDMLKEEPGSGVPTPVMKKEAPPASVASPSQPDVKADLSGAFGSPTSPTLSTPIPSIPAPKALDFVSEVPAFGSKSSSVEAADYVNFILDVVHWTNKVRSVVYFLGGLGLIYLVSVFTQIETPFLACVSFFVLFCVAINFLRNLVTGNKKPRTVWVGSALVNLGISTAVDTLNGAAQLLDKYAAGVNPVESLQVVALVWGVSIAARLFGPVSLLYTIYTACFVIPPVYKLKKADIDSATKNFHKSALDALMKLDAKVRLAIFALPLLVTFFVSRVDTAIALLCLALYGSTLLQPAQVENIQARVQPILQTAQKKMSQMSGIASSVAVKYELTPTPHKKKPE